MTQQEIIQGCSDNKPDAQYALFRMFSGKMMSVCLRYANDRLEAEDMLQEGFIRIFQYIGQYRNQGSFEGWIKRIVVHAAIKILRDKKINFIELTEVHENRQLDHPDSLSQLNAVDLLKVIGSLPAGYRTVFNLYALEGYSHEEIGSMLQIKPATSRSQLSKARVLLMEKIKIVQKIPG